MKLRYENFSGFLGNRLTVGHHTIPYPIDFIGLSFSTVAGHSRNDPGASEHFENSIRGPSADV
jgi:hypothetical protein